MFNLLLLVFFAVAAQDTAQISGLVQDENNQPVSGVEVILHTPDMTLRTSTDDLGRFRFYSITPGAYSLDFNRAGFFQISGHGLEAKPGANDVSVVLNHEYEIRSQLDVLSPPHEVVPEQMRHEEQLAGYEIRENPVPSSHNLQNSLPALPEVVQDNTGDLHVAGARVEDTLYSVDGFQINNPATGAFVSRVNVDSVREADMSTGRYGAQYANAATGVLALQTDTGDDHRRFGITNFPPTLSTERGVHLGNWFPRVTFSGPIKKGRAWFADGASLQHDFTLVRELPPSQDISEQWAGDNLLRGQFNVTSAQSLQANFLYNGSTSTNVGLNAFAPASTTTDQHAHQYFLSGKDQITIENGLVEIGMAADTNHGDRIPQGTEQFVLTPTGPQGNYFSRQVQNSTRWQGMADALLSGRHWRGSHEIRVGINADRTSMDQTSTRQPVQVQQADGILVRQSVFTGNAALSVPITQEGAYAQDEWKLRRSLMLQSSFRIDRNSVVREFAPQPRFVLNWVPGRRLSKFTAGWGLYYEPIYPSFIAPAFDQNRTDFFGVNPVLTSFRISPQLRQPFFNMASAEWQQQWTGQTSSDIHLTWRSQHHGLAYENAAADPLQRQDFELQSHRNDRYESAEITLRRALKSGSDIMLDYTYSQAHSNEVFTYSVEDLVIAKQAGGPLPWDTRHRVVSRGALPTKRGGLLWSYFAEYRTGFPFSAVNSSYVVVNTPNGYRYPSYFSLNAGVEKRIPFYRRQWAVRLAVINVTGHRNFNAVINNVDAPNFLTFAGGQARAFTFRLRLVGRS
jgi:hypothetical protein